MPTEVIMPALGMAQETGRIIAWLKQEGDTVERGEPIIEIETDKTTVEFEASASGTLVNIMAQAGEDVPVGDVIALILAPGESAPVKAVSKAPEAPKVAPTNGAATKAPEPTKGKGPTPLAVRVAQAHGVDVSQIPSQQKRIKKSDVEAFIGIDHAPADGGRVLASPKARRLAQERGLELVLIAGSGPQGAVLAADVLNYQAPASAIAPASQPEVAVTQTGQMWRRMAERLTESWQSIPHFYLQRDVNAVALTQWREKVMTRSTVKVTFTDLLVKLNAAALRQHPYANGRWNGESVVFNDEVNVGLAVAVEEGLIVPVIHNADTLGVTAIAQRRQELVERATQGQLRLGDLQGATFTISNLGMYGVDEFSAIVNPPQAAILAVGRITERLVPVDGQAVVRPMLTLTLSCDHRAVDGARGAQFLDTLAQLIEDPLKLMD